MKLPDGPGCPGAGPVRCPHLDGHPSHSRDGQVAPEEGCPLSAAASGTRSPKERAVHTWEKLPSGSIDISPFVPLYTQLKKMSPGYDAGYYRYF